MKQKLLMDLIRGSIGKLVFRARPDGTIILSGAPVTGKARPAWHKRPTSSA